jgi:hypothetical protein
LGQLKPNPKNPNRHPERQLLALSRVIQFQGWRAPILVSKRSGLIVAGHARYEVAKLLNLDKVPIDFQDFESAEQEYAHLCADNLIPELAELDAGALDALVASELKGKIELDLAGILDELEEPTLQPIVVQPAPTMGWVLIGIPLLRWGEIAAEVEKLAAVPDSVMATTYNNDPGKPCLPPACVATADRAAKP